MKKFITIILFMSIIFLVACSNEKPLLKAENTDMDDTVYVEFFGKKDNVNKMIQKITYDMSDMEDDEIDKRIKEAETKARNMGELPAEIDIKRDGKTIIEILTLKFEDIETNKTLQEVGLLNYPGNIEENIKIDPFVEAMEQAGYTLEKNFE